MAKQTLREMEGRGQEGMITAARSSPLPFTPPERFVQHMVLAIVTNTCPPANVPRVLLP